MIPRVLNFPSIKLCLAASGLGSQISSDNVASMRTGKYLPPYPCLNYTAVS